jgi:hypothetical protein
MPEVRVHGSRFESYTLEPFEGRDGSFVLVLKPGPRLPDMLTILVSGGHSGDAVIVIKTANSSVEVKSLSRHTWVRAVDYGELRLVIRRPNGRRSYRLMELDARRIAAR